MALSWGKKQDHADLKSIVCFPWEHLGSRQGPGGDLELARVQASHPSPSRHRGYLYTFMQIVNV